MILLIIAAIVYFVMQGDDTGTDETPAPEETTSTWEGEPGAPILLAGRDGTVGLPALSRSA